MRQHDFGFIIVCPRNSHGIFPHFPIVRQDGPGLRGLKGDPSESLGGCHRCLGNPGGAKISRIFLENCWISQGKWVNLRINNVDFRQKKMADVLGKKKRAF